MAKKAQQYIAIPRHAFYDQKAKAFLHSDIPMMVSEAGDKGYKVPEYHVPDSVIKFPVQYFLIPVTSRANWDAHGALNSLLTKAEEAGNRVYIPNFTTLKIPQLWSRPNNDHVAILNLCYGDYQRCKRVAQDQIIEVNTVEELLAKHRELIHDEPASVQISETLSDMLARVPDGPLHGTVVVAFDQQIAGSLAAEELVRAGATVIKVEKPDGDPKRHNSSPTAFNTFNAGKFSVVFSDSKKDQELKRELLARADVIIDNRSEKAQKRDDVLQNTLNQQKRAKPLIYCAISGFGRGTEIPAYDRSVQAAAGMAELNGKLISFPLIDMATGKEAAREIANYLFRRERMTPSEASRSPCIRLDVSMAAVALNMMANPIATYLDTGQTQSTIVPFDLYETKNGKMAVSIATDAQFQTLCDVIGTPELKKFKTNQDRQQNRQEVESRLHAVLAHRTTDEWVDLLTKHNLSGSPVVSLQQALSRYGHDIIKPTQEGGLYVTSPTRSNVYPRNPRIGNAPRHDGDHQAVSELVNYLQNEGEKNPRALRQALEVASEAPDKAFQDNYRFVDAREIDFSGERSDVPWAKGRFFGIRKIGKVHARTAKQGEVVDVIHSDKFSEKTVAMENDMIITTSFGDRYLMPQEKFLRNYVGVMGEEGVYMPNPELKPRKAIIVNENIRFMSPMNDITYIPKGGWIVEGSDGPYGIHPNNIKNNYEMSWAGKVAGSQNKDKGQSPA